MKVSSWAKEEQEWAEESRCGGSKDGRKVEQVE